ncbi:hypothetical protein [uncultured Methylophaga sp.]|uniref:alpha-glutamyl/putrescinyl thymine pyrophosphorylase clade 3 protein n=1 Tax=uncultured Methylophaga sp. TaxID=285271 RepID=UPI002627DFD1|nr:hypothetical protein [uncultured Methylophaga sp.]
MKYKQKQQLKQSLHQELNKVKTSLPMPGVADQVAQEVFVQQILDSIRRVDFVYTQRQRNISAVCAAPTSDAFDPIKAAIYYFANNQIEEAFWLVFLSTFTGKHKSKKWIMLSEMYSMLGTGQLLTWDYINNNFQQFSSWYEKNHPNITRAFGNHRKFETLKAHADGSPINVFSSYIHWVGGNHQEMISDAIVKIGPDPKDLFDYLFNAMSAVKQFGRTSRFDYLTMLGKVGLAHIEPPNIYLQGSTGPLGGAKLLFGTGFTKQEYEGKITELGDALTLGPMSMQVLEDSLCNWQKSPRVYKLFIG